MAYILNDISYNGNVAFYPVGQELPQLLGTDGTKINGCLTDVWGDSRFVASVGGKEKVYPTTCFSDEIWGTGQRVNDNEASICLRQN